MLHAATTSEQRESTVECSFSALALVCTGSVQSTPFLRKTSIFAVAAVILWLVAHYLFYLLLLVSHCGAVPSLHCFHSRILFLFLRLSLLQLGCKLASFFVLWRFSLLQYIRILTSGVFISTCPYFVFAWFLLSPARFFSLERVFARTISVVVWHFFPFCFIFDFYMYFSFHF